MLLRRVLPALALGSLALVAGCKDNAPPSGPEPIIEAPPVVAPVARKVSGALLDASSGQLILAPITVSIRDASGAPSTVSLGADGKQQSVFKTTAGVVSFEVDSAAALPIALTVVVTGEGFISTSANVAIEQDGESQFAARLVAVSAPPPEGVVLVEQSVASTHANGAIAEAVQVSTGTPDAPADSGGVSLAIPAQTVVTTAEGTPLVGEIKATVSYFSNTETASLAAFPGGLLVTVPTSAAVNVGAGTGSGGGTEGSGGSGHGGDSDSNSATTQGTFISGGFAAIQLRDSAGNIAAHFDKPIEVTVAVRAGTVNPRTRQPVQAGDVVPFWSYDETTGRWSGEGTGTLELGSDGKNFLLRKNVTHLSYFNIDWLELPCTTPTVIHVTGNGANAPLELELLGTGGGYYKRRPVDPTSQNIISLTNDGIPAGQEIKVSLLYQGSPKGSVTVPDLCTGGDLTIPVDLPAAQPATLRVHAVRSCIEDPAQTAVATSATVVVAAKGSAAAPLIASTDANGDTSFAGLAAGSYDVSLAPTGLEAIRSSEVLASGDNYREYAYPVTCQVAPPPNPPGEDVDHAPAVQSVKADSSTVMVGASTTLTVKASDPDGDSITYAWKMACYGSAAASLGSPAAGTTTFTATMGPGNCVLTVTATAKDLLDSKTVGITVEPATGTIGVTGAFIPRPSISSVGLATAPACSVARSDANATCAGSAAPGATLAGSFQFAAMPAGTPLTALVRDSCGGNVTASAGAAAGAGSFTWIAPSTATVCVLTVELTLDGLTDQFPIALPVGVAR